jgi:Asp-tRNA(Asn)/Glu-tRNA(Gln) amidotransferase A subunit family amidase
MSEVASDELARIGLKEAASGICERRFTAEALANAYAERIRRYEPRVRAWAWIDDDRALASARAADRALHDDVTAGPLHGLPIGVKDIIHVQGIPTGMGSPIFAGVVPGRSATCVQRLERAGAFLPGKTVTTEFATQQPGPTTNPWNAGCTPGGSSSGSAAAVAAGFVAAALGTQTRGSLIRPAAYCGVVGFKPSYGVISRDGVLETSATLDQVGVLAHDVDDAGLVAQALMGEDARDPRMPAEARMPRGLDALRDLERPPRLAAVRSPSWPLAEPAQRELFEANCRTLRARGARVEAVELVPPFERGNDATRAIQLVEIARNFAALKAKEGERMSATFRALCARGEGIADDEYREALGVRDELRQALERLFADFDAIVTPPATGEAPATLASTGDAAFCGIWTLCGVPCVVIPTGLGPHALPMGLQVVGAYLDDARALEIARWCARQLPFSHVPDL